MMLYLGNDLSTHDKANNKDISSLFSYQTHYKKEGSQQLHKNKNDHFFCFVSHFIFY